MPSRREFLKNSSAVVAVGAVASQVPPHVHAAGSDEIRFCVVGCGGRGTGAAAQIFNTKGNTRLVAVADAFERNAKNAIKRLNRHSGDKVAVSDDQIHWGLDAYRGAIDSDCDLVVIATPPGFKPQQFEYAIDKGKHVFMEKPVATDAPGVRRVLRSVEESKKKNLMVALGLQRRHEPRYVETIKRIHDGAIGDVVLQRVYWNGGGIWYRNRQPGQSEMEFQVNNWYHFNWVCGDQICEQHIHNLDVANWVKDDYPIECNGMGGGEQRMSGDRSKSQIFDHTFCEFTYPDGSKLFSQGRHLAGAWSHVGEAVHGTKGVANPAGSINDDWQFEGPFPNGHQQEQHDMIAALMNGDVYNEGEYGAKSTFTSILGREACYSGQILRWDDLLANGRELAPGIDQYTFDTVAPTQPNADGLYFVPTPGVYKPMVEKAV